MPASPKIYEAHVGMSSKEPKVATYLDFAETVIPRIKRMPGLAMADVNGKDVENPSRK